MDSTEGGMIVCPRCKQEMEDADCAEGCEDFDCPLAGGDRNASVAEPLRSILNAMTPNVPRRATP